MPFLGNVNCINWSLLDAFLVWCIQGGKFIFKNKCDKLISELSLSLSLSLLFKFKGRKRQAWYENKCNQLPLPTLASKLPPSFSKCNNSFLPFLYLNKTDHHLIVALVKYRGRCLSVKLRGGDFVWLKHLMILCYFSAKKNIEVIIFFY